MQLAALFGIGVLAAAVVYIFNTIALRRRHARLSAQMGCRPVARGFSSDPSGMVPLFRGFKASRAKQFPDFVQENFERVCGEEGRAVGTVSMRVPFFRTIMFTTDPQNVQAILALKFKDFGFGVNRTENFKPLLGAGIFAANGKQWEHSRALLRPQFVRSQVSDLDLEEKHVQAMMRVIDRHSGSADRWTGTVDLQVLFFRLTLDSATEFLFGESVNSQMDANISTTGSQKDDNSFAFAFDKSQYQLSIAARLGENYWLLHTPEFHRMVERVHKFVDYFVQKAMQREKAPSGDQKHAYVFLNALAEQTQDPVELRSQLLNILLAGRDTTASLLSWFFYTLATEQYQPIFKRLRALIVEEFGTYSNPREITFERMKACQYLQWCINEALRLYPVVPMNVRTAMVDTSLPTGGGADGKSPVFVPKGMDVGYSVFVMHRRKDLWGQDADTFRPERWENRKPGWDYLPFNGGPRICIGQQFALTETAYVIIRLMQRIDAIDGAQLGPIRHGLTLTNCPANGVKVRVRYAEE